MIRSEALEQTKSLYLPERGVVVELPASCYQGINICPESGQVTLDPLIRAQLKAISSEAILQNHYPALEYGENFMGQISPQWRDRLLEQANVVTRSIVKACQSIGKERFAVLLFGSVAKNLVKFPAHSDPSNIDIAVIGDFIPTEKKDLFDLIRPVRQEVTDSIKRAQFCKCETIHCRCRIVDQGSAPDASRKDLLVDSRVGVFIQTPEVLRKDGYGGAREYVASCAKALYDPEGVWGEIEHEVIAFMQLPVGLKRRVKAHTIVGPELEQIFGSWDRQSPCFQADKGMVERVIISL